MKGSSNHVRAGVAAAAILIGTVAGTAIAASTSSPPPATTCGIPYTFRFDQTTLTAGSCAGLLPRLPAKISMRLGQRVSVEIAHETNGSLDYPVPSLEGSAVRLLGRQGPTAIFQARSLGTSELLSRHTRFCESSDPAFGTCPVLVVRVIRPRATGLLAGAIRFVGGPAVPKGRPPSAGTVVVFTSAAVRMRRVHGAFNWFLTGHRVALEHVRAGHLFRFTLTPGRYELELAGGSDCRPSTAVVRSGRVTHVDVPVGCLIP